MSNLVLILASLNKTGVREDSSFIMRLNFLGLCALYSFNQTDFSDLKYRVSSNRTPGLLLFQRPRRGASIRGGASIISKPPAGPNFATNEAKTSIFH